MSENLKDILYVFYKELPGLNGSYKDFKEFFKLAKTWYRENGFGDLELDSLRSMMQNMFPNIKFLEHYHRDATDNYPEFNSDLAFKLAEPVNLTDEEKADFIQLVKAAYPNVSKEEEWMELSQFSVALQARGLRTKRYGGIKVKYLLQNAFSDSVSFEQRGADGHETIFVKINSIKIPKDESVSVVPPKQQTTPTVYEKPTPTELDYISTLLNTIPSLPDGYKDLTEAGQLFKEKQVNIKKYAKTISVFIQKYLSDVFELRKGDASKKEPIYSIKPLKAIKGTTATNKRKTTLEESASIPVKKEKRSHPLLGDELGDFAEFNDVVVGGKILDGWGYAIDKLAGMALKEEWYYDPKDKGFRPTLRNYLSYTFARLQYEDKLEKEIAKESGRQPVLKILASEEYAIFNTGLVDNLYEPIYAIFRAKKENEKEIKQKWVFSKFGKSNSYDSDVLSSFSHLPKRAEYYKETSELVYDRNASFPSMNWDHIVFDNIDRIPFNVIMRSGPFNYPYPDDIILLKPKEKADFYDSLKNDIKNNSTWQNMLFNTFKNALTIALNRVAWNYKTAIPIYSQERRCVSLMLPLALENPEIVDLALVCEHVYKPEKKVNNYIGRTIYTLNMAYNSARLITRLERDWL